jgi:hypothetical protein
MTRWVQGGEFKGGKEELEAIEKFINGIDKEKFRDKNFEKAIIEKYSTIKTPEVSASL